MSELQRIAEEYACAGNRLQMQAVPMGAFGIVALYVGLLFTVAEYQQNTMKYRPLRNEAVLGGVCALTVSRQMRRLGTRYHELSEQLCE
jgi:hypothetical protein